MLRAFFPDYLRLVEPDAAGALRLDRIRYLDLPAELDRGEPGLGFAAVIPEEHGEKVTAIVRVEPHAPAPEDLSRLLGRWLRALEVDYGRPLLIHLLSLQGARPGLNLETAVLARLAGIEAVRAFYTHLGLAGARAEFYLGRPEPLCWALASWMRPAQHPRSKLREACRERIAAAALSEEQRALLLALIDAGETMTCG